MGESALIRGTMLSFLRAVRFPSYSFAGPSKLQSTCKTENASPAAGLGVGLDNTLPNTLARSFGAVERETVLGTGPACVVRFVLDGAGRFEGMDEMHIGVRGEMRSSSCPLLVRATGRGPYTDTPCF